MRWTWLCLSSVVLANALEPVVQQNGLSRPHGHSAKVQQILDELRQVSSVDVVKSPSMMRTLLGMLRNVLVAKSASDTPVAHTTTALDGPIAKLREVSSVEQDLDATFLLAEFSMHGNYSYPRDYRAALDYYSYLAEATGNMTAHENLALLYSTGMRGVEADQGLALVHHTFAASQGSVRSHMALGFRQLNGIGVAPNCSAACEHYATAAKAAVEWIHSGPPGGMYWNRKAYRYSDDLGGLYGSVPPRPLQAQPSSQVQDLDDVIDYYLYMAEKLDVHACFSLGRLYNDGTRTVDQDFVKSLYWYRQVARTYWLKDGKNVKNVKATRYHAKSAAYIATAYLRGEGTDQDFDKAKMWFLRGVALGDAIAHNGLALMYLIGLGPIQRDLTKAEELFKAAADNEHHGAQINLGKMLAARGDIVGASRLFQSAARAGYAEAFYFLAQFFHHGIGEEKSCIMATQYYKIVAESVETLHSTIPFGNQAYREGRVEDAIVANLIAAESGYEIGQLNVAFLLDKHRRSFSPKEFVKAKLSGQVRKLRTRLGLGTRQDAEEMEADSSLNDELALLYYSRSAAQQNLEALVKAGDYHFYGHGTVVDPEKAVNFWTTAAETRMVPLALWNLAWSYENGVGVEQDFHMAKRYYDACLEVDKKASLPVNLSLLKLRARSAWNTMTGGTVNSIKDEEVKEKKVTWTSVWTGIKHFWRSQWDIGELNPGADAEADGTGNFVDEDYPVAEEDFYDTLLIMGVCLLVAGIVYVRTTWWPQTRRPHGAGAGAHEAAAPQADGPNPHLAEWIVRRV